MKANIIDYNIPNTISNKTICYDMYVGTIKDNKYEANNRYKEAQSFAIIYEDTNNKFVAKYSLQGSKLFNNSIILCILESPHKREYSYPNYGFAAMGGTGKLFDKKLLEKLKEIGFDFKDDYDIVLINAVQYQCSNGKTLSKKRKKDMNVNKYERDINWIRCMDEENCQKDLLKRIEAFNPKYIINLCTIGLHNLQLILDNKIKEFIKEKGYSYTFGNHPSTWYCHKRLINKFE